MDLNRVIENLKAKTLLSSNHIRAYREKHNIPPNDEQAFLSSYYSRISATKASSYLSTPTGDDIPLVGMEITAKVVDFLADVSVVQYYHNTRDNPIEAIMKFPRQDSTLYGFSVEINGQVHHGQCKAKQAAQDEYNDAIASGHTAYYATKSSSGFSISVGNLPAQTDCKVTLHYFTHLESRGNWLFLNFKECEIPLNMSSDSKLLFKRPERFSLVLEIVLSSSRVLDVKSYAHHIETQMLSDKTIVTSSEHNSLPLGLFIEIENPHDTFSILEVYDPKDSALNTKIAENDTGAIMITLNPQLGERNNLSEIIFLIDRSGSMDGTSIEQAKNALQLFLRALPIGTLFNIWGFGSSYHKMSNQSIALSNKTLKETSQYVNKLQADLGGTQILEPLQELLQPTTDKLPKQIMILTDGEVTNTHAVLDLVDKKLGDSTRIFTFGIGESCQRMVSGIALHGKGKACYVQSGERIEEVVMEQLQYILQPILTNIEVDWGTLPVLERPLPLFVPPLFPGSVLKLYTFLSNLEKLPTKTEISIKGSVGNESLSWKIPFNLDRFSVIRGSVIHKLTAQNIINNMEKDSDSFKEEIIHLGTRYSIASKHTAFIAVSENTDTPATGSMETVDISTLQTRAADVAQIERDLVEIQAIFRDLSTLVSNQSASIESIGIQDSVQGGVMDIEDAKQYQTGLIGTIADTLTNTGKSIGDFFSNFFGSKEDSSVNSHIMSSSSPTPTSASNSARPFDVFIILQKADGSFSLKHLAEKVFQQPLSELIASIPQSLSQIIKDKKLQQKVWATVLAMVLMEKKFSSERTQWVLLEKKCKQYIISVAPSVDMKVLLEAANLFYGKAH